MTQGGAAHRRVWRSSLAVILVLAVTGARSDAQTSGYGFIPSPAVVDEDGFVPIFDGTSLNGWSGDHRYWRVENGSIVGETTPQTLLKDHNNFIVWRGGEVSDFELRARYRISREGNSGINYRSADVPDVPGAMTGYQFDIDGPGAAPLSRKIMLEHGLKLPSFEIPGKLVGAPPAPRVTANIYEELGRGILALAGTQGRAEAGKGAHVDALLGSQAIVAQTERSGWNDVRIIARGNVLIHVLNGRVMAVLLDDDAGFRRVRGRIGMQVHVGPPSRVEFRDLRLKRFD